MMTVFFLEVVWGWSDKGIVYGLVNNVSLFHLKPTDGANASKTCRTPSIVSQLQSELELTKTKLSSTKDELQ